MQCELKSSCLSQPEGSRQEEDLPSFPQRLPAYTSHARGFFPVRVVWVRLSGTCSGRQRGQHLCQPTPPCAHSPVRVLKEAVARNPTVCQLLSNIEPGGCSPGRTDYCDKLTCPLSCGVTATHLSRWSFLCSKVRRNTRAEEPGETVTHKQDF